MSIINYNTNDWRMAMPINKDNNKNIRKPSINSGSQVRRDSSNTENFSRKPPHKPPKR